MRSFDYRRLEDCLWDGEVVSLLSQIHEYKGRQDLFVSQRPSSVARLVDIAKVQSVESSNRIEGIVTTKARIRSLVADKTTPRNRDEEEIMGYRDVLNTVHENYEYIDLTRQIVLQLHRDLYAYSHKGIGGQYKNVQNLIIERLADGSEVERFKPLAPYETPAAIDEICQGVNAVLQDKSTYRLVEPPCRQPAAVHRGGCPSHCQICRPAESRFPSAPCQAPAAPAVGECTGHRPVVCESSSRQPRQLRYTSANRLLALSDPAAAYAFHRR